jgi:LacI family transcriptional regulator, repressor for deo operon, udp, cdd, tsx, nupC, and nupG
MIPKQSVNMTDVARRAGVSIASVSRALRAEPGVSQATRDRILTVADELAYVVSPEASRLSGGQTGRIGVVVPRIDSWFYGSVLAGIAGEIDTAGMDLVVCALNDGVARRRFFEMLPLRRKVDAVVVVSMPLTTDERRRLEQLDVPTVFVGGDDDGSSTWIGIDDEAAADQAVGHLIRLGHRDIAMIQAEAVDGESWATDQARIRGFHRRIAAAGLAKPDVVTVKWGADGGALGMEMLLSHPRWPTAVFCHSDQIAIGALRTLRRAGIPVPQQISVIGVDDEPVAEVADLTTVAQPVRDQGTLAAGRLIAALESVDTVATDPRVVVLPTRLVIRGSTAPPN